MSLGGMVGINRKKWREAGWTCVVGLDGGMKQKKVTGNGMDKCRLAGWWDGAEKSGGKRDGPSLCWTLNDSTSPVHLTDSAVVASVFEFLPYLILIMNTIFNEVN